MIKSVILIMTLLIIFGISFTSVQPQNLNQNNIHEALPGTTYGTSQVSLNTTSIKVALNTSYHVSYTVKLTSGTTWGTSMVSSGPSNISVSLSSGGIDPTFNGVATITPTSSSTVGNYTISFKATGDDPSTNTVTLNVTVVKGTSGTSSPTPPPSPPPPSSVSTNYVPYMAGGVVFLLFFIFLGVTSMMGGDFSRRLNMGSTVLAIGSSIYLLTYDPLLKIAAYYHWLGLLVYVILMIIAFIMAYFMNSLKKVAFIGMFTGNLLLGILMISDAVAGLPVSQYYNTLSNVGWNYLFGFGTTSISTVDISSAFSLLLLMIGLSAGTSLYTARNISATKNN